MIVKDVVDRGVKAFQARDREEFASLFDDHAEIVGPGGRVMRGPDGARELFDRRLRPFENFEQHIDREQTVGSTVLIEGTLTGQPAQGQEAWPMPPDAGEISVYYAEVFTVAAGLIVAHRVYIDETYARSPPWEIGRPQPSVVDLAERGRIAGRVLDLGCGTGENTLFLADRGRDVVGVDASPLAVEKARLKAQQRELPVTFVLGDVKALARIVDGRFDAAIDSGLLHVLPKEDHRAFERALHQVLAPNGWYYVQCLSEHASMPGPHHLTKNQIADIFADGWKIASIQPSEFELDVAGGWTAGQAAAWLAAIQRL